VLATISAILVIAFGVFVLRLHLSVTPLSLLTLVSRSRWGRFGIVAVGLVLAGCRWCSRASR
jgi:hypothetical protein